MLNKENLIEVANQNLDIIKKGYYTSLTGKKNEIRELLSEAKKTSELVESITSLSVDAPTGDMPEIFIYNEGVIDSILEERALYTEREIIALNFASAKNPGGGFLKGSKAQEEAIMRGTLLYPCIEKFRRDFYDKNIKDRNPMYSDSFIYTSDVPVIRNESQNLIDYKLCSFITAAAVNKGYAITKGVSEKEADEEMTRRINKIVKFAVSKKPSVLILGAFGCGVFKNDPEVVAKAFRMAIEDYAPGDIKVVFAIRDNSNRLISVFKKEFFGE